MIPNSCVILILYESFVSVLMAVRPRVPRVPCHAKKHHVLQIRHFPWSLPISTHFITYLNVQNTKLIALVYDFCAGMDDKSPTERIYHILRFGEERRLNRTDRSRKGRISGSHERKKHASEKLTFREDRLFQCFDASGAVLRSSP